MPAIPVLGEAEAPRRDAKSFGSLSNKRNKQVLRCSGELELELMSFINRIYFRLPM